VPLLRSGVLAQIAVLIALLLPGSPAEAKATRAQKGKPRVVVAVVDGSVNPFHEFFHAGGSLYKRSAPSSVTPAVLKEFGIDKQHIIRVTRTGNFSKDFALQKAQFDKIKKGEPYWFKGTNVIGISFEAEGQRLRPDGTGSTHGVGTTGAVLAANPEAIVVNVDGINDESEKWAFTHPAVDVVTTSYGPVTSVPTLNHLSFSYTGVVANGKAHFGAAANDPTLASLDETGGPWWSFGIGGFEEGSTEGRQMMSGSASDFVADFTQELPYCKNCEDGLSEVSGTSFASPRSAGTFSKVLLEARRASGHVGGIAKGKKGPAVMVSAGKRSLTVWDLRRALEEAAYYPVVGDYQPGAGATFDPTSVPVFDPAPWLQTGWGVITPDPEHDVVTEALAHLGIGRQATRSKGAEVCAFMTANMDARHAYWDNVAALGESFGTSDDPYVYC
jgi:hypothetical protein